MGQTISCPCYNSDSNVVFGDEDEHVDVVEKPGPPDMTNLPTNESSTEDTTTPFKDHSERTLPPKATSIRRWNARSTQPDFSTASSQRAGEDAVHDGETDGHTSLENMAEALHNVKGEIAFPSEGAGIESTSSPAPRVETEAERLARERREAHNDRIVATFNSVMLADGLKVLKHHRRSSKKAASRVIRYVPDYGGALVWDKPLRQPGAKASRVPLDAIKQVELENRIVWISAGDERVGFETSKAEDADLMYQAICILVDRCHARA